MSSMICCQTCPEQVIPTEIPNPIKPEKPNVKFIDNNELLTLTYEQGKDLAIYLQELETYIWKLLAVIEYYKPDYEE